MSYNGWTNYETWTVSLLFDAEYFEGHRPVTADDVEDAVESDLFESHEGKLSPLAEQLLRSAMSEINFRELAERYEDALPASDADDD